MAGAPLQTYPVRYHRFPRTGGGGRSRDPIGTFAVHTQLTSARQINTLQYGLGGDRLSPAIITDRLQTAVRPGCDRVLSAPCSVQAGVTPGVAITVRYLRSEVTGGGQAHSQPVSGRTFHHSTVGAAATPLGDA